MESLFEINSHLAYIYQFSKIAANGFFVSTRL